jgi:hypothetical protein
LPWLAGLLALVAAAVALTAPAQAQSDETVPDDADLGTTLPGATTSILATTTTTAPECKELAPVTAIFVGTVTGTVGETARFAVAEIRQGALPATRVQVDYPNDIRFVKEGHQYVVGVTTDPATQRLVSKVRPARDVEEDDPCNLRDLVYTRNVDGTNVDTGIFSGLSGKGWRIAWSFLLPTLIALALLTLLVLFKRAGVGAFRFGLKRAAAPPRPSPPADEEPLARPPVSTGPASRTPARPGPPPRP